MPSSEGLRLKLCYIFGPKKIFWVEKNFWVQNFFGSKILLGLIIFWFENLLSEKYFGSKIFLGQKKFGSKKFW